MSDVQQLDSSEQNSVTDQVALRDIFWLVTAIAAVFAYAKSWGQDTVTQAVVYMVLVLVLAGTIGFLAKQIREALFWSALTSLVVFIAVAGGRLPNEAVEVGWGSVAAVCGALAGVSFPSRGFWAIVLSGIAAILAMLVTLWIVGVSLAPLVWFDVLTAGLVGCVARPFLDFLRHLETRAKQPRIVLAAWLTLVFLLGNFLVPIVGGVAR